MSTVSVWLNGAPLVVPQTVDCLFAARGALGLPRGMAVAYEDGTTGKASDNTPTFKGGYTFSTDERFVVLCTGNCTPADEDEDDELAAWESDPDAWKRDSERLTQEQHDEHGEPVIDDENIDVEEWGIVISVPQLEIQLHDKLGVVVVIVGPWFREMLAGLGKDQDRLAWPLAPDTLPVQRKQVHEALMRSFKLTPNQSADRGEETDDDAD